MAVNDSEKKAAELLEKKIEKGKEMEHFNEIQGQIANLQAEQRNNLSKQRVISNMEAQNNQILSQAAGVLAAESSGGGSTVVPINTNQNTNAILNKYGIGKPGKVSKTTTVQTQTPQRINVTNTTNTTNNIQIAQPQIPISAPNIPMRAGGVKLNNDTDRFKVWVNNAFAKQNEAAAIREKEYNKKEWSLTKTTNKMIQKMGDIGKTIGKAMSPKNIGNMMGDQLKIVMFLLGFHFIANNIQSILNKVDGFLYWISGGEIGVKPLNGSSLSLGNTLKSVLGIDKNKSFLDHLKDLFGDLVKGFSVNISNMLAERREAVKQIEFPKINLTDGLPTILTSLGSYLADVVTTAVTGTSGLEKIAVRDLLEGGRKNSTESYEDKWSHTNNVKSILNTGLDNITSMGDAVLAVDGYKDNFKMADRDYTYSGKLANNVGSSVKQATYLGRLFESGGVNSGDQIISGLSALSKTAKSHNEIYVPEEFLDHLGNYFNIRSMTDNIKIRCKRVKTRYILVKKTMAEMNVEGREPGFVNTFAQEYIENKVYSETMGGTVSWAESFIGEFERGNIGTGLFNMTFGMIGSKTRAFGSALGSHLRSDDLYNDYTIMMVSTEDDRYKDTRLYPSVRDKEGKILVDEYNNTYLVLTNNYLNIIENEIRLKVNSRKFSFDSSDPEVFELINSFSTDGGSSGELDRFRKRLSEVDRIRGSLEVRDKKEIRNSFINSNPFEKDETHIKNPGTLSFKTKEKERIAREVVNKLYSRLSGAGLGLTTAQIAGFIGNVGVESGFDPKALNPSSGASGLCQWLGPRKDKFYGKYRKYPHQATIDEQIDFIIEELKGDEAAALEAVKNTTGSSKNSAIAAEAWARHYERPAEHELALETRAKYAAQGIRMVQERYEEAGITDESIVAAKANSNGSIMAIYNTMKVDPNSRKIMRDGDLIDYDFDGIGDVQAVRTGDGKLVNSVYKGFLGQNEYNLAAEVFNGRRKFTDLVLHEELNEVSKTEEARVNRLKSWGTLHEKFLNSGVLNSSFNYYCIQRLMANTYKDKHKMSDAGLAYNSLKSLDTIQLLSEFILKKYYEIPWRNLGYYHGDIADNIPWSAMWGHYTDPIESAKDDAVQYLLGLVDNDKLIALQKANEGTKDMDSGLLKTTYKSFTYNDKHFLKGSDCTIINEELTMIDIYLTDTFYNGLVESCRSIYSECSKYLGKGLSDEFIFYTYLRDKNKLKDLMDLSKFSDAEKTQVLDNFDVLYHWSRPAEQAGKNEADRWNTADELVRTRAEKIYTEQLSNYLVNEAISSYLGDQASEAFMNGVNTADGYNPAKIAEIYSKKFGINKLNLEGLGDKANDQYYTPLYNILTKGTVTSLGVYENGEGSKSFSVLDSNKESLSIEKNKLDAIVGSQGYNDYAILSREAFEEARLTNNLDHNKLYIISDSNDGNGNYSEFYTYDENTRTERLIDVNGSQVDIDTFLKMDPSTLSPELRQLQQSIVKEIGLSSHEMQTGIDVNNLKGMLDYQTISYVVGDIRHNTSEYSQFSDKYVTEDDPLKGYRAWAKKNNISKKIGDKKKDEQLRTMADAIAMKYDIKAGSGNNVKTAYEELLKGSGVTTKDEDGNTYELSRLEHILVYGARSPWYNKYIEKRTAKDGGEINENTVEFSEVGNVSERYGKYREQARLTLDNIEFNQSVPNGLTDMQKNFEFFQKTTDDGKLSVLNVDKLMNHLYTLKHVDAEDFLMNKNGVLSSAAKNQELLKNMDFTDKVIANVLMNQADINSLINNNTIVNGQYLKAMTELLSIVAVNMDPDALGDSDIVYRDKFNVANETEE